MRIKSERPLATRAQQRGVVLFIALIVLVAMTLAGLSLMRSVGTGVLIAGNLAVKQGVTSVGDLGVEAGRKWLMDTAGADAAKLNGDVVPGYLSYAAFQIDPVNPPSSKWWEDNGTSVSTAGTPYDGHQVRYVVNRLCNVPGVSINDPSQQCVTLQTAGAGSSKGGASYGILPLKNTFQVYYRITVRVVGPKNTISYVQTVLY
jgi:Tfp pilus assembly protein PilX